MMSGSFQRPDFFCTELCILSPAFAAPDKALKALDRAFEAAGVAVTLPMQSILAQRPAI